MELEDAVELEIRYPSGAVVANGNDIPKDQVCDQIWTQKLVKLSVPAVWMQMIKYHCLGIVLQCCRRAPLEAQHLEGLSSCDV